jgi:pyruvate/2-oxoglutarate dehydrogenase complex dihydrolipoamide acyltransferase (E2) component
VIPTRLFSSADLITGTIKLPLGRAVAIPTFMNFLRMILSPSTDTFTITNLGAFGSTTGTPIINQPEVAILAVGAIKKKPAVIETPQGDMIGIRNIMVLSLSYDHRVVDGALGGMFLKRVAEYLENFDTERSV